MIVRDCARTEGWRGRCGFAEAPVTNEQNSTRSFMDVCWQRPSIHDSLSICIPLRMVFAGLDLKGVFFDTRASEHERTAFLVSSVADARVCGG